MVLNFLAKKWIYKVFSTKVQISQQWIQYLGFVLTPGTKVLAIVRKIAIIALLSPTTERQFQDFLGMAGFCHIWIPNYGLIAKPLYEFLKGSKKKFFQWIKDHHQAFETLKTELS